MASITWLHLSDLHFRAEKLDTWNRDIVLKLLLEDVRERIKDDGLQPDLVLVSGDIAFKGAADDYALGGQFFRDLLSATGLGIDRLFLVPGNHDVDRGAVTRAASATAASLSSREAVQEVLGVPDDRRLLLRRLDRYAEFVRGMQPPGAVPSASQWAFDDAHISYVEHLTLPGQRVAVLGLNSAWLARGGEEDRAQLVLGERQVREALDGARDAGLRIALLHHPFEWLREFDQNDCEDLLMRDCHFILHGHLHRTGLTLKETPDARAMLIGAGAAYQDRKAANAYNFLSYDAKAGRGTVYLRRYSDERGGFWAWDTLTYRNARDGTFAFALRPDTPAPRGGARTARRSSRGGTGDVVSGGDIFVGGDIVTGVKITPVTGPGDKPDHTPAIPDPARLEASYLRHVIDANRCLQLQGIRAADRLVSIELEEIYVTLTATDRRKVEAEEDWLKEAARLAPGEAGRLAAGRPHEAMGQVRVKVQDALAVHPRLVVLGDPGCGKTTLLRYLALTYARDLKTGSGLVAQRLQLDERRLPVLLPLREFARYLQAHHPDSSTDGPKLLLDHLYAYFANQNLPLPAGFLTGRLERGECAVLLDGVDEVADLALRQRVSQIVERFTIAYPGNRYVVTSRIVGYTGAARLGADYAVTTVRDFTEADIERFVGYWSRAVEVALAGEETAFVLGQAGRQAEALLKAIRENERVRDLAVNPLLLTVIALVQRYRAQLPERRTELYEEAIEVLLGKWDEPKRLEAKKLLAGRELDAGDRRGLLEPVALWMMEHQVREIEADELRRQLGQRFHEMLGDWRLTGKAVGEFLRLIEERSGLLAERGQGIYAFSHLTFQEHLAARGAADRPDYIDYTLARLGEGWWREAILLEAGYLSTQGKQRATALIQAIMDCKAEPEPYHNLVLAAECLRDVGPARVEGDLWGEVQRRLRREFERPLRQSAVAKQVWKVLGRRPTMNDAVRRRAVAAEALARIESGGPGTQPAFWRLPHGEPVWATVPAGEFWMGGEEFEDERPVHRVHLDAFQIARVPVTNAQYRLFVEATGHKTPRHWEDGRLPRGLESHPVVYVTWHDAMAYCGWLSEATGKSITLPSEAQWEKAARGDRDRREYPWGDEWSETRCNCDELGLGGTTPVGIFPEGASPYGCLDISGNVWEWTRSLWSKKGTDLDFKYPYRAEDGREDLEAGDEAPRVLRGGSFVNDLGDARCAVRSGYVPGVHGGAAGFRDVLAAPIFPPSAL